MAADIRSSLAALSVVAGLIAVSPGTAHAATDADRVRAVLDSMNASYNRSDFDAFATHLCGAARHADGFKTGWYASRLADGPTRITVNSVDVVGGPASLAIANVRFEAANHEDAKTLDIDFLRESTGWKACRYHAGYSA